MQQGGQGADRGSVLSRFMAHLDLAAKDLDEIISRSRSWSNASPIHRDLKVLQRDMAMLSAHALKVLKDACELDARQRQFSNHKDLRFPASREPQEGTAPPQDQPEDQADGHPHTPEPEAAHSNPPPQARPSEAQTERLVAPAPPPAPRPAAPQPQHPPQPSQSETHRRDAAPPRAAETAEHRNFVDQVNKTAQGLPKELLAELEKQRKLAGG